MFDRRSFLALGSSALGYAALGCPSADAAYGSLRYPGVNLAGGEFGTGNQLNHDYIYPSERQVAYYASRGFRLLRVPVKASRLIKYGKANLVDIGLLRSVVDAAAAHNMRVLIDLHEYALRPDGTPMNDWDRPGFRAKWRTIAAEFRSSWNVWFGLMNEPYKQTPEAWFRVANAGIAGIRDVAPDHFITVMGSRWGTADGWISSGNAAAFATLHDPSNRLIIEMHQYLDRQGGVPTFSPVVGLGATALVQATQWARAHGRKLFLGEFGTTTALNYLNEGRALLRHMYANSDVWIGYSYWAGGRWWQSYGFSVEPASIEAPIDRPQMWMLRGFM